MPVPTTIDQLSTTAASNYPQGTDSPSTLDDFQRAHGAFIRQLQTGAVATTANVTGGTINGATVGATTPSTGAFTTLSATGTVTGTAVPFAFTASGASGANHLFQATNGTQDVRLGIDGSNNCYTGTVSAHDYLVQTGGYTRGTFSSTGLAVTGALSATGAGETLTIGGAGSASNHAQYFRNTSGYGALAIPSATDQYLVGSTAGDLAIGTNNKSLRFGNFGTGALQATLSADGNLGLGITPSAWGVSFKSIELASAGLMSNTSGSSMFLMNNAYYNGTNWIYKYTAAASHYDQTAGTHQWYTAPSGTAGNAITFTQSMTLDASGNHWVGSSAGGNNNFVVNQPAGNVGISHISGTASGALYTQFTYNGGPIGSITQNGTTAVAYNTTSDHRLKENVRPADAARFMDIEFVDFEWTDGRHDCGVIAHQLQSVYPDLVIGEKDATEVRTVEITPAVPEVKDEDGNVITPAVPAVTEEQTFPVYQQVNYIGLIGRMGTRIQQLQRTVDAQAEMLAAMEARLAALEAA